MKNLNQKIVILNKESLRIRRKLKRKWKRKIKLIQKLKQNDLPRILFFCKINPKHFKKYLNK
jgi:hypothetical protein